MISTDGGVTTELLPLNATEFNCFDTIEEDDIDKSVGDPPIKATTLFDATSYGSDTAVTPEPAKRKRAAKKTAANDNVSPLEDYTTVDRRVNRLARTYEPTAFDKSRVLPVAANDNQKRKQTFPALDEARNNTLMAGRDRADTLLKNEWAFDILLEIKGLLDAAAPKCSWLQHNGHGQTDEHAIEDGANPGYGVDAKHDYGPSVKKVKRLWEYGSGNKPSKNGDPWNLGAVELTDVVSKPSNKIVKALRHVGGLQMNDCNNVTHFRDNNGYYLTFKTKIRGAKGQRLHPKVLPDPIDTGDYDGAALPRNKRGELKAGFIAGKIGSSNSATPCTLDFEPDAGPLHSAKDPWAAQLADDSARDEATIALSQHRLLVGPKAYDALTQAASGFRIGELCGGRLGNTTDSARARTMLQFAIERIIEDRSRTFWRSKQAA
jgi:hypothetical protein